MNENVAVAVIAASKLVRKTLDPLSTLDELTPELIKELKKLRSEVMDWGLNW